jgi:hypothetical protein
VAARSTNKMCCEGRAATEGRPYNCSYVHKIN